MNGARGGLLAGAIPAFRTTVTTTTFVASTSKIVRRNELIGVTALIILALLRTLFAAIEWSRRRNNKEATAWHLT
jgi:hypothetical protein